MTPANPILLLLSYRIVTAALNARSVWPDEIETGDIPAAHRGTVGNAFKSLAIRGVLRRSSDIRRSKADGSKGRTIFRYDLADEQAARAFLRENDGAVTTIPPMPAERPAQQPAEADPGEVQRLRAELATARTRIQAYQTKLARWGRPSRARRENQNNRMEQLI